MHRHRDDPEELAASLPQFYGGEFIVKKGHGKGTPVYCGKIEKVSVPDFSKREILISCRMLYKQFIGCDADHFDAERWQKLPPRDIRFEYSWFYPQERRRRLKLEFESPVDKKESGGKRVENDEPRWNDERCWLCSAVDPINLGLFRLMLQKMFLEESLRKQEPFAKRIRNRLLAK